MPRTYRVGFAQAQLSGLFAEQRDIYEALLESWQPGAEVTRYGRTWILSRLETARVRGPFLQAQMGFVNENQLRTLRYDRSRHQFIRETADSGVVVPLVINYLNGLIAFQLIGGQVRVRSVVGALQGALNAQRTYSWNVLELVNRLPYRLWRESVDRVTEFRFRIELPNPHWPEEGVAQALLDALRLEVATITGRGEEIDTSDEAFQNLLNHVIEQYGTGTLVGLDADGERVEWKSVEGGLIPAVRRVESEGEEEILTDDLVEALETMEHGSVEVLTDDESDDLEGA